MKLIIQVPCFNEALTLPDVIRDLPRSLPGVDCVEYLVIDDGSVDGTGDIARSLGVHHVVRHSRNLGLARAFRTGLEASLVAGADIVVNTDGDNQYGGPDVAALIAPILDGEADLVVGDRGTDQITHFSPLKRCLQRTGSRLVRRVSGVDIPDAVSGFRAMSRKAAMRINIVSSFSYTIEMLIQSRAKGLTVVSVPVRTNPKTRESRLFRSPIRFIERSVTTMLRMYAMYKPLRAFLYIGLVLTIFGLVPIARFLWLVLFDVAGGHIQSLILGGGLVVIGLLTMLIGIVADLVGFNRQLIEMTLEKVRALEFTIAGQQAERGALTTPASGAERHGAEPRGAEPQGAAVGDDAVMRAGKALR